MGLRDDVRRIADAAEHFATTGERVEAVLPAEPAAGRRIYLVAFSSDAAPRRWLALDGVGGAVTSRDRVREAVSITAICEVAEESVPETSLEEPPRLASPSYLDALGAAAGVALGAAIQQAFAAVEELANDVEANYKLELT